MFGKGVSLQAVPGVEFIRLKENKEELGEIECFNSKVCVCVSREAPQRKMHGIRGDMEVVYYLCSGQQVHTSL